MKAKDNRFLQMAIDFFMNKKEWTFCGREIPIFIEGEFLSPIKVDLEKLSNDWVGGKIVFHTQIPNDASIYDVFPILWIMGDSFPRMPEGVHGDKAKMRDFLIEKMYKNEEQEFQNMASSCVIYEYVERYTTFSYTSRKKKFKAFRSCQAISIEDYMDLVSIMKKKLDI